MKRALIGGVAGTLLAVTAAAPAFGSAPRAIPDVQQLYSSATQTVRHADKGQLAKATLLEADGSTPGGTAVSTAAGITRWHFVFDNDTAHSPYASATVDYGPAPKAYGKVVANRSPFTEDLEITRAPKLSLSQAVAALRRDGEHRAFNSVILRDPLEPPVLGARYIFGVVTSTGTTYVQVSATTGKRIG